MGIAAFVVLSTGCAGATSSTPRFQGGRPATTDRVVVEISNIGWADAAIYSVAGGARIRLGTAISNTTARFELPRSHRWASDLHLEADPIGSARVYASDVVSVSDGQVVRWRIHETRSFRSLVVG